MQIQLFLKLIRTFSTGALVLTTVLMASADMSIAAEWGTDLQPGDTVCLWDIHGDDALVKAPSSSFKSWYKDTQKKPRLEIKPEIRELKFKVLYPGLKVIIKKKNNVQQPWYSGRLVVVKGGQSFERTRANVFQVGENTLYHLDGTYPVPDWHVLSFEAARFKKNVAVLGCKRKYKELK